MRRRREEMTMGNLGVFRDDFYNAIMALTAAQVFTTAQASGVIPATAIAGAQENYVVSSGATALTTDSAVNIIAQLSNAVNAAVKANVGGLVSGLGAQPAVSGIPNLFNLSFFFQIGNTNAGTLTITGGAGVTVVGSAAIATASQRGWVVTVTSANTVTISTVGTNAGFAA